MKENMSGLKNQFDSIQINAKDYEYIVADRIQ